MQTIDQWLEEKTTELEKTFPTAKYAIVVVDDKNTRTLVSNITNESLQGMFSDLSEDAGDHAYDHPVGRSN